MVMLHLKNRQPATLAVVDSLIEQILTGALPAGSLLRERTLCEQIGVSRTVVREALARLAQLRLVATKQGGDTRVLDFRQTGGLDLLPWMLKRTEKEVDPLAVRAGIEMRAALAPEIAGLCARRGATGVGARLSSIAAQMRGVADLMTLQRSSLEFWATAAAGCENLAYQLAFNSLRDAIVQLGETLARGMEAELRNTHGYIAIAEAICRDDEAAARRAAEDHVELGLQQLHYLPKKRPRR